MTDTSPGGAPPASPSPRPPVRRRRRRLWLVTLLTSPLWLVILVLTLGVLVIQTPWGRGQLVAFVEDAVSGPDTRLGIQGLTGFVPFEMRVDRIVMSGPDGPWLEVEQAHVAWSPWRLAQRRLVIERLSAARVVVRAPPASEEEVADEPFQWPRLPVRIAVDHLAIADLSLELLDPPARVSVQASGDLGDLSAGVDLDLAARRLDGAEGTLDVHLRVRDPSNIAAEVRFREEEGGIAAQLLDLPGRPPVAIDVTTTGTPEGWSVTIAGSAGDAIGLEGDVALLTRNRLDGRIRLDAVGSALPALGIPAPGGLALDLAIGGTIQAPEAVLDLDLAGLDLPGLTAETAALVLDATLAADARQLAFAGRLDLGGAAFEEEALATLAGASPRLAVTGQLSLVDGFLTLSQLELDLPAATLTATGTAEAWGTGGITARIAATIADLAAVPYAEPASGPADVQAELSWREGRLDADVSVAAADPLAALGLPPAFQGAAQGEGRVRWADGTVGLSDVTLVLGTVGATVDGSLGPEGADLAVGLEIPDLGGLGAPATGAASATLALSGPLDRLAVDLAAEIPSLDGLGVPVERLTLRGSTEDASAMGGTLAVEAQVLGRSARVSALAGYDAEAGSVRLDDLSIGFDGLALDGAAALRLDPLTVAASLSGETGPLAALAEAFGVPIEGSGEIAIDLGTRSGGAIEAEIVLDAPALEIADTLALRDAQITATIPDLLAGALPTLHVAAAGAVAGGQALGRLEATAALDGSEVDATLALAGGIADLTAAGRIDVAADPLSLALDRFSGRWQGIAVQLASPTRLTFEEGGVALSATTLGVAGGQVTIAGQIGETLNLSVNGSGLSVATLAALGGEATDIAGQIGFEATVTGPADAPRASGRVTGTGIAVAALGRAGFTAVGIEADFSSDGQALAVDGTITSAELGNLVVAFRSPLDVSAIEATIRGRMDVAALNPLLAATGDRITGALEVDVGLSGPIANLQATGSAVMTGGTYANALYGVSFRDLGFRLTGAADGFVLSDLRATAENGGTVSGEGRLGLDAGRMGALDLRLRASNARVLDLPIAEATVDADLTVTGSPDAGYRAAGSVTARSVDIDLGAAPPASLPTLDVVDINVPPELERSLPRQARADTGQAGLPLTLDVQVSASRGIRVTGHGLVAELGGSVRLRGTLARPELVGSFQLADGHFDFLGQRLQFTEGVLTFTGEWPVDPLIRLVSSTSMRGGVARIGVHGTLNNPQLLVESDPPMPTDEVLARVLFGRASSELSTGEAIQLANALAEMTGIGGATGIIGDLQSVLGVDRLDIGVDAQGQPTVSLGERISDRVVIGVEQGSGGTRAVVEVEITDNIRLEGGVGTGGGRVGVTWEWEY